MYIKKQNDKEPYQVIITEKEMKEAFRNPVTYELFRQALISQIMDIYYQSRCIRYEVEENEEDNHYI